jgi:hypothetical protein
MVPINPASPLGTSSAGFHSRMALRKCFSFPVFLATLLAGAVFMKERVLRLDPDTWWHIRMGQDILVSHRFPHADVYSFTAYGHPWVNYEWLGDVILAVVMRASGLKGLGVLLIVLSCAIMLLLYGYCCMRSRNCKAALLACALPFPLISECLTLRPQLLGYIFFIFTLICLERLRKGSRWPQWALPLTFLLWVNTHGTFPLGFIAIGLTWLGSLRDISWGSLRAERWQPIRRRRLEMAGVLSLLVLPITPYGWRVAISPLEYSLKLPLNLANIQEWLPLNFNDWAAKLLLGLVFVFLIAQVTLRLQHRMEDLALFLFATYSTLVHARFIIMFGLVFAPILAMLMARWLAPYSPAIDRFALNFALIALAVAAMVWGLPSQRELDAKVAADYPVQAVRYLREHPPSGAVFNQYNFGGYLVWSRVLERGVFIDGRGDLYESAGTLSDYLHIIGIEPDTLSLLQKYGIQTCLISRGEPLATLLAAIPAWKQIYSDKVSVILIRDAGSPAPQVGRSFVQASKQASLSTFASAVPTRIAGRHDLAITRPWFSVFPVPSWLWQSLPMWRSRLPEWTQAGKYRILPYHHHLGCRTLSAV